MANKEAQSVTISLSEITVESCVVFMNSPSPDATAGRYMALKSLQPLLRPVAQTKRMHLCCKVRTYTLIGHPIDILDNAVKQSAETLEIDLPYLT